MAEPTTDSKPATFTERYARQKLVRLAACERIEVWHAGDDEIVCAHDQIALEDYGAGLRHSREELRQLRELAGPGWPR